MKGVLIFHFLLLWQVALPGFSQPSQDNSAFPEVRIYISDRQLSALRDVDGL